MCLCVFVCAIVCTVYFCACLLHFACCECDGARMLTCRVFLRFLPQCAPCVCRRRRRPRHDDGVDLRPSSRACVSVVCVVKTNRVGRRDQMAQWGERTLGRATRTMHSGATASTQSFHLSPSTTARPTTPRICVHATYARLYNIH